MGTCITKKTDECDFINCLQRPDSDTYKSVSESLSRRSYNGGLERKTSRQRATPTEAYEKIVESLDCASIANFLEGKTAQDLSLISSALRKIFLFNGLTDDQQEFIIKEMKLFEIPSKTSILKRKEPCRYFYVIVKGRAEVIENGKRINVLAEGDTIGEMSLINDVPSLFSVKSMELCILWGLGRNIFRKTLQSLNAATYEENKIFIESVPIFNVLTKTQREALVTLSSTMSYSNNQNIIVEGDSGDVFFIIKEGSVVCKHKEAILRILGVGEYFGEQAMLYGTPRTATVEAIGYVRCLAISGGELTKVLGIQLNQIIYRNSIRISFEKSGLLGSLSPTQTNMIISKMKVSSWDEGSLVIQRGSCKNEVMHVILKGKLTDKNGTVWDMLSILGEEEMVKDVKGCYEDLIAIGKVDLATITKVDFSSILGTSIGQAACNNELLLTLKKVIILRGLSNEKLKTIVRTLQIQEFPEGSTIFCQNTPGEAFYIIKKGKVDIVKDGTLIRSITKLDYFGERSLIFNELRSASVIALESSQCWVLKKSDFFSIIDERMRNLLIKRIQLQDTSVTLSSLLVIKKLGSGMLGNVLLTSHKETRQLYALKSISRNKIDNEKVQDSLTLERKILMQLDHGFILKLIKTFKDDKRIYFLLEYVRGEDLFDVIRNLGLLSNTDTKFYACCILIILEHLHEREIAYRDLKPENIMADEEGYPKLIDFGTAKIVSGRTYTMVGTPHYMAPEVILGKGYSITADYWSLGIIIYEFLCGVVPFGETDSDSYSIFEKILEGKIAYPTYSKPVAAAKNFIEDLLNKNPVLRIGGCIERMKSHPWLSETDWEGLIEKKIHPPYLPVLPNLDWDMEKAFTNQNNIDTILGTDEEQHELSPKHSSKVNRWDDEF